MAHRLRDPAGDAPGREPLRRGRRRAAAALLLVAVVAIHGWLGRAIVQASAGFGGERSKLARLEVDFVRELAPAPPPAAPAEAAVRPRPARAAKPARQASSPAAPRAPGRDAAAKPAAGPATAGSEADELAALLAAAEAAGAASASAAESAAAASAADADRELASARPSLAGPVAASAASAGASGSSATGAAAQGSAPAGAFEWPPSTELSYGLTGRYRGELHGDAQVRWIRRGDRYQVHLDVAVGPRFAPLMSRRMTSDGVLGDEGLQPRRYEEISRMGFGAPRQVEMRFDRERVRLANGDSRATVPGLQDTASQFVQLTWMFSTQPALLQTGRRIELPLALPRRVDDWVYDVVGEETLLTPLGELATFHLKPRREPGGGVLTAEAWFAPSLQYLPVRIVIHQDRETFIDLLIRTPPLQAERGR